ncbi:hypothetical protein GCM10009547_28900 [Sporichthya brevicatena]|uniref:Uncharacterized protein n=1 Tax=Sporichthya brevicatena TaxID=171442 RepID=A0ABP3S6Q6_9ACTN
MSDTAKAFWEAKNSRFAVPDPRDEFLHPEARVAQPGPELTETQALGFSVPEHGICGLGYLWHHPNLGVVTGGAWVWRGVQPNSLASDLFDIVTYVDDAVLADDLHRYRLPNGYEAEVVEPLRTLRARYADEPRGNAFEIEFTALAEPMVLETGFHLEQPMRTRGTLTLDGRQYEVDGYSVRDRSWGQLRREVHSALPPMTWLNGVLGPDLSFGATAFDSPDLKPEWAGTLEVPGGDPLRAGWICRDGVYSPVVAIRKRTHRNPATLFPESVDVTLTDDRGLDLPLRGTILAASEWRAWHNMSSFMCLARWETPDGLVGHGDFQDILSHGYLRTFLPARPHD